MKLFVRRDAEDRAVAVTVALPRERYNAELQQRLAGAVPAAASAASRSTSTCRSSETEQARDPLHGPRRRHRCPTSRCPSSSTRSSRSRARGTTGSASGSSRRTARSAARGWRRRTASASPTTTRTRPTSRWRWSTSSSSSTSRRARTFRVALQNERGGPQDLTRVGIYKTGGKVQLSEVLPILENLGLRVDEEVPTRLNGGDGETFLHNFGVLDEHGRLLDLDRLRRARRRLHRRRLAGPGRSPTRSTGWSSRPGSPGSRWRCCARTASTASASARAAARVPERHLRPPSRRVGEAGRVLRGAVRPAPADRGRRGGRAARRRSWRRSTRSRRSTTTASSATTSAPSTPRCARTRSRTGRTCRSSSRRRRCR